MVTETVGTLRLDVTANTGPAQRQLRIFENQTRRRMSSVTSSITRAGASLSLAFTAPLAAASRQIVQTASAVELLAATSASIAEIQLGGVFDQARVGEQTLEFTQQAAQIARDVRFTTSEIAEAQVTLSRAGFSANTLLANQGELLRDVSSFAVAANLDLNKTAEIASRALGAFGLTSEQERLGGLPDLADALTVTAASAATTVTDLGQAITFVGPVATTLGVSIEETSAALGVLANAGFRGTLAGTGLRRVLSGLANPTGEAAEIIERLGIQISDARGDFIGLQPVLEQFQGALAGLGETEQTAIAFDLFGQRGGPAFLNLVSQASGELVNLEQVINSSEGATREFEQALLDTASGQFALLRSALESFSLTIANSGLLDFTRELAVDLKAAIDGLSDFIDTRPEVVNTALSIGAALSAIGPSLLIFGALNDAVVPAIASITARLPLIAAVAAPIGAAAASIGLLITQSEALRTALADIGGSFVDLIAGDSGAEAFDQIGEALGNVLEQIGPTFEVLGDQVAGFLNSLDGSGIVGFFVDQINRIPAAVDALAVPVAQIIEQIAIFIGQISAPTFELLETIFVTGAEGIAAFAAALVPTLELLGEIIPVLLELVNGFLELTQVIPGVAQSFQVLAGALLIRGLTGRAGPLAAIRSISQAAQGASTEVRNLASNLRNVEQTGGTAAPGVLGSGINENFGLRRTVIDRSLIPDSLREEIRATSVSVRGLEGRFDSFRNRVRDSSREVLRLQRNVRAARQALNRFDLGANPTGGQIRRDADAPDGIFRNANDGRILSQDSTGRFRSVQDDAVIARTVRERQRLVEILGEERTALERTRTANSAYRADLISLEATTNTARNQLAQLNAQATQLSTINRLPLVDQYRQLGAATRITADSLDAATRSFDLSEQESTRLRDSIRQTGAAYVDSSGQFLSGATTSARALRGVGRAAAFVTNSFRTLAATFGPLLAIQGVFFAYEQFIGNARREAEEFNNAIAVQTNRLSGISEVIDTGGIDVEPVTIEDIIDLSSFSDVNVAELTVAFGRDFENEIADLFSSGGLDAVFAEGINNTIQTSTGDIDAGGLTNAIFQTLDGDELQPLFDEFGATTAGSLAGAINQSLQDQTPESRAELLETIRSFIPEELQAEFNLTLIQNGGLEGFRESGDDLVEFLRTLGPAVAQQFRAIEQSGDRLRSAALDSVFQDYLDSNAGLREAFEAGTFTFNDYVDGIERGTIVSEEAIQVYTNLENAVRDYNQQVQAVVDGSELVSDLNNIRLVAADANTQLSFLTDTLERISGGVGSLSARFDIAIDEQDFRERLNEALEASTPQGSDLPVIDLTDQDLTLLFSNPTAFIDGGGTISDSTSELLQILFDGQDSLDDLLAEEFGQFIGGDQSSFDFSSDVIAARDRLLLQIGPILALLPNDIANQFREDLRTSTDATLISGAINQELEGILNGVDAEGLGAQIEEFLSSGDTAGLASFVESLGVDGAVSPETLASLERLSELASQLLDIRSRAAELPTVDNNFGFGVNVPESIAQIERDAGSVISDANIDLTQTLGIDFDVDNSEVLNASEEVLQLGLDIEGLPSVTIDTTQAQNNIAALRTEIINLRNLLNTPFTFAPGNLPGSVGFSDPGAANGGVFGPAGRIPGFANGGIPSGVGLVNFGRRLVGGSVVRTGEAGTEMVLPSPVTKPTAFARTIQEGVRAGFFGSGVGSSGPSSTSQTVVNNNQQYTIQGVDADQVMARIRAQNDSDFARSGIPVG